MTLDKLNKYRGIIITTLQTLIILAIAFILTILSCGFNFKEFNWVRFIFSFVFTVSMKAIYTSYSKNKEMLNEDIITLRATINKDKREIFDCKKTEEFKQALERRNNIKKLDAYITKLDNAKQPNIKERDWAFNYKQALVHQASTLEYEKIKSLNSIKINYEHIEYSKLFTYGQSDKIHKNKYTFSSFQASFNRAIIPTTLSIIFSILFGTLQGEAYLASGNVWIDLFMYLFSICLGGWWGLNNGKTIINEDYTEVLNNIASLIREIKKEVLFNLPQKQREDNIKRTIEEISYNIDNYSPPVKKEVIPDARE